MSENLLAQKAHWQQFHTSLLNQAKISIFKAQNTLIRLVCTTNENKNRKKKEVGGEKEDKEEEKESKEFPSKLKIQLKVIKGRKKLTCPLTLRRQLTNRRMSNAESNIDFAIGEAAWTKIEALI